MRRVRKSWTRRCFRHTLIYFLAGWVSFGTSLSVVLAGPEDAQVVHGQVSFQQSGNNTTITASDQSIINYSRFDIARPEVVQFIQPGSNASVLNRILSANPTSINGTLLANGRVFFVNPAGVIIGSEARINVNQLVASALNISNDSFINGQYEFVGGDGVVANYGDISAQSVYLVGKQVTNVGNINCPAGYVVMAAGDRVFLGQPGSNVIVEIGSLEPPDQADVQAPASPALRLAGEITNEGTVQAAGGTIILAAAGDALSRPIMKNVGSLSTSTAEGNAGDITLQASQGQISNTGSITAKSESGAGGTVQADAGEVVNAGTIDVSGAQGGTVALQGTSRVDQFGTINADGVTGDGGSIDLWAGDVVALGGDSLTAANADTNGDGGEVIAFTPGTAVFAEGALIEINGGSQSGDGGFAEISGKEDIQVYGLVQGAAPHGARGRFVIDPVNVRIGSGGHSPYSYINTTWLEGQLNSQFSPAVEIVTTDHSGSGIGWLHVDGPFGWTTDAGLTLWAHNNVEINAAITNTGGGDLKVYSGQATGTVTNLSINENITAGSIFLKAGNGSLDSSNYDNVILVADSKTLESTSGDLTVIADDHIMLGGEAVSAGDLTLSANYDFINKGNVGDVYAKALTAAGSIDIFGDDITLVGDISANGGNLTITGRKRDSSGGTGYIDVLGDTTLYASGNVSIINGQPTGNPIKLTAHNSLTINAPNGAILVEDTDITAPYTPGDVTMEAGSGGIDIDSLTVGASGLDYPGEISLSTTDGGNITTGPLEVKGNGYGSIYVSSSGNLTINGSSPAVWIKTNVVPTPGDAFSFACLIAEEDVTINGDVTVEAHGKKESVAGVWIGAGTNVADPEYGYPGTVTVNGNILSDASVTGSEFVKSDATIRIYASTINLNGNKDPEAKAKGGGVSYQGIKSVIGDESGIAESDAVYEWDPSNPYSDPLIPNPIYDKLVSGSRALVDIDITKDGTCLNCGNVILPIALPDWLNESKNIMVYAILVLENDQDGEGGPLIDGTVFLDGVTQSEKGGTLTLINSDTEVQYEPPPDWVFDGNGKFTDYFSYYCENAEGDISAEPALVMIVLRNELPVAIGGYATTPKELEVDIDDSLGTFTLGSDGDSDGIWIESITVDPLYEEYFDPIYGTVDVFGKGPQSQIIGYTYKADAAAVATNGTFDGSGTASGFDSFQYTVTDGLNTSTASATGTINLTNELPQGGYTDILESKNVSPINVEEANPSYSFIIGTDPDLDPVWIVDGSIDQGASPGTYTQITDGGKVIGFNYTPDLSGVSFDPVTGETAGYAQFSYEVTDGYNTSTVDGIVDIDLYNQFPVAQPDSYDTVFDMTLSPTVDQGLIVGVIPMINGDFDPDGDGLTPYLPGGLTSGQTTYNGTVTLNPDGSFIYNPPAGWGGVDTFTYYVNDGYNNSDPVPVTITASIRTLTGEEASATTPPGAPDLGDIGQIEGTGFENLLWLAEELGLCEGDQEGEDENRCQEITQAYLAGAFLQSTDLHPHRAAARLRELAAILHDTDGGYIAALGRVVNEFVNPAVPPSPEQFASISQALAGGGEGTDYATAGQWLDALTECVTILVGDIGWPAEESIAFAMGKYGPSVTETGAVSVTAFIQMYLEGLIG